MNVVVVWSMNDLYLTKSERNHMGWNGRLPARVLAGAGRLVAVLKKCSRACVVGPGSAQCWNLEEAWNAWARQLMQLVVDADTPVLNPLTYYKTMGRRVGIHFADLPEKRMTLKSQGVAMTSPQWNGTASECP